MNAMAEFFGSLAAGAVSWRLAAAWLGRGGYGWVVRHLAGAAAGTVGFFLALLVVVAFDPAPGVEGSAEPSITAESAQPVKPPSVNWIDGEALAWLQIVLALLLAGSVAAVMAAQKREAGRHWFVGWMAGALHGGIAFFAAVALVTTWHWLAGLVFAFYFLLVVAEWSGHGRPASPGAAVEPIHNAPAGGFEEPTEPPAHSARPTRRKAGVTAHPLGVLLFTYTDSKGETTERRVMVHDVDAIYLKGYCTDRRAARTFRLDRIEGRAIVEETGELLHPWELEAYSA